MNRLSDSRRRWLNPFDWNHVTDLKAELCKSTKSTHAPTSDGHAECKALWGKMQPKEVTLIEAPNVLKQSHRLAPFCFNNGNTFAAIARTIILQLDLGESAALVRSAVGHYVAGVLRDDEIGAVLDAIDID